MSLFIDQTISELNRINQDIHRVISFCYIGNEEYESRHFVTVEFSAHHDMRFIAANSDELCETIVAINKWRNDRAEMRELE